MAPALTTSTPLEGNLTNILINGESLPDMKGFSYKAWHETEDMDILNSEERRGLTYGRLRVRGKIVVYGTSPLLNSFFLSHLPFQIVLQSRMQTYTGKVEDKDSPNMKQISFDGCHVEDIDKQIEAGKAGLTVYTWTADRMREL